jgi:hypothetical protein
MFEKEIVVKEQLAAPSYERRRLGAGVSATGSID